MRKWVSSTVNILFTKAFPPWEVNLMTRYVCEDEVLVQFFVGDGNHALLQ